MLRAQPFDRDRVELYLGILKNEKDKNKKSNSSSAYRTTTQNN